MYILPSKPHKYGISCCFFLRLQHLSKKRLVKYTGCNYSRTPNLYRYYSGAQPWSQQFLHHSAITKFYIHFFLLKKQVHILQKKPANPYKIKVSSIANKQSPHVLYAEINHTPHNYQPYNHLS